MNKDKEINIIRHNESEREIIRYYETKNMTYHEHIEKTNTKKSERDDLQRRGEREREGDRQINIDKYKESDTEESERERERERER